MTKLPSDFSQNAAFLYCSLGPHPATASSVESAGIPKKRWYKLKQTKMLTKYLGILQAAYLAFQIPKYKYYFVEGSIALQIAYFKKIIFKEQCIVIARGNDDLFYQKTKPRAIQRWWYTKLRNTIDGILCIATLVEKNVKSVRPELPTRIARSFLHNEQEFFSITPNIRSKNILFVGQYRAHKGIENMIEGFLLFLKKYPEATFTLVGKNISLLKERYPHKKIRFLEAVYNVKKYAKLFSNARIYLHCPIYEAGPRTIFETLACGVIPLVNELTGNKDLIMNLDKKLIIKDNNPKRIAKGLEYAYNIPPQKLKKYSKFAKIIAKTHTFKKGTTNFVNQLASILNEIQQNQNIYKKKKL